MKKLILIVAVLLFTGSVMAQVYQKPYIRKNGTYVQPTYRSSPNKTKIDNYGTKGNYNPYSGKKGARTYDDYSNYGYKKKKSLY